MSAVSQCRDEAHRHWPDPATGARRCIECDEAWLDRLKQWQHDWRKRRREQARQAKEAV